MGSHYETMNAAETSVGGYTPLQDIGDDKVPAGQYAIGLDLSDGGAFFVGTIEDIVALSDRINNTTLRLVVLDQAPLRLKDFEADEDGAFACPRCEESFDQRSYSDFAEMAHAVDDHAASHTVKPDA